MVRGRRSLRSAPGSRLDHVLAVGPISPSRSDRFRGSRLRSIPSDLLHQCVALPPPLHAARASDLSRFADCGDAPAPRGRTFSDRSAAPASGSGQSLFPDSRCGLRFSAVRLPPSASRLAMIDVSIIVVSHNDERDLPLSVGSALAQRGVEVETIVVDNASGDGSRGVVEKLPGARLLALTENVGFAAAMNRGIEATAGRYVLALNPDCRLEPDFASTLTRRLDSDRSVGSASGRILRATGNGLD